MRIFEPVLVGLGRLVDFVIPPPGWRVPVALALSALVGVGAITFHASRASSYLYDDPQTCVNCHVMAPQYATWFHSAHREFATCNDCHVPKDNVFAEYAAKARDGSWHAFIFTFRLEPQVIRIHSAGQRTVQQNCIRCHEDLVHGIHAAGVPGDDREGVVGQRCWDCHRETPHGQVNSLASVPYEHIPLPGPVIPGWLRELTPPASEPAERSP